MAKDIMQAMRGRKEELPQLLPGQFGFCVDTDELFIGNGDGNANIQMGAKGEKGDKGDKGIVFTPSISEEGILSWTNDGELPNPPDLDLKEIPLKSITADKITDYTINNMCIGDNAVDARTIKDGEITEAKLDTELQDKIGSISNDYDDLVNKPNIKKNSTGDIIDTHLTVGKRGMGSIGHRSFASGLDNIVSKDNSGIVGGHTNTINAIDSGIIGGYGNTIKYGYSSIISSIRCTAERRSTAINCTNSNVLDCQVKFGNYCSDGASGTDTGITGDALIIGNGSSDTNRSNAFRVAYNGNVYGLSAFNSTGADYAEMFEWTDGNPNNEDRRGLFAYIENGKMRLATAEDMDKCRLGVIAATPAVVGDNYDDNWCGKYLTDVFGAILTQKVHYDAEYKTIECIDPQTGEPITCQICVREECDAAEPILNPDYDPEKTYIPRAERSEYDYWSFCGKLVVVDDGTCKANGYCYPSENGVATSTENGFYVMERLDDTHIRILLK